MPEAENKPSRLPEILIAAYIALVFLTYLASLFLTRFERIKSLVGL